MNRAFIEMVRSKQRDPNEKAELGNALDALSASFDKNDTTLKRIPQMVFAPSVLLGYSGPQRPRL